MIIQTEMYFPLSQAELWEAMGNLANLNEWLDPNGYYLPPTEIRKLNEISDDLPERWLMVAADGQEYQWDILEERPGLRLMFALSQAKYNPMPIEIYSHDWYLEQTSENHTLFVWTTEFVLGNHGPWWCNWWNLWHLHNAMRPAFEEMQLWSLTKLYKKVVKNGDITADSSPEWYEQDLDESLFAQNAPPTGQLGVAAEDVSASNGDYGGGGAGISGADRGPE
jgi:hypothetical protein